MFRRLRQIAILLGLLGLAVTVCVMYCLGRMDEEIRAEVERRFRAHYPTLSVNVRSARWFEGQGIRIRGVSIVAPTGDVRRAELAYVEEILAVSNANLKDLVLSEIPIEKVVFRGLTVHSTRESDGQWSGWRLWPPPSFSDTPPEVRFENAQIKLIDPRLGDAAALVLRDINLDVSPTLTAPTANTNGKSDVHYQVRGALSSDHFRRATIDGSFRESDGRWSCSGGVENLTLSPELWQSLPQEMLAKLPKDTTVRGRTSFRFEAATAEREGAPARFAAAGDFSDVRVSDWRLPYPIIDFQGTAYIDEEQLRIDKATARCGPAFVQLSYRRDGWSADAHQSLWLRGRDLPLDPKLIRALPDGVTLWEMLQPTGTINLEATLTYDGLDWQPEARLDLVDTSFAYEGFPYRLVRGKGRIEHHGDELSINVSALASGQLVRIEGKLTDPGTKTTGWLEIASHGPVPLNDQLLAALDERGREIVSDFAPRGAATVWGRVERSDPAAAHFDKRFLVNLHNCSIKHKKFPYPIESVQGVLEHREGKWDFRELEGWRGGAHISCRGGWTPEGEGSRLELQFEANQVPLDDDLRYALSPDAQKLWGDLRPRGVVDQLKADLAFTTPGRELKLDVHATRWPNQPQTVDRRPITLIPVWFPYRLDNVTGSVHFHDGIVDLHDLHAVHESARISGAGHVTTSKGGPWRFRLERLSADRLRYDRDLAQALPPGLEGAVARLSPTGPLSLSGWLEFTGSGRPGDKPDSQWDLTCETVGGSINAGVVLENVHGGLRMVGRNQGGRFASRGLIDVDALFCKGVQFTQVQGPIYFDNSQVLLGAWTPAGEDGQPARRLTAGTLGGVLEGDARRLLSDDGDFLVQASLVNGDLKRIAQETTGERRALSGKVIGQIRLGGTSHGAHTWRGEGLIRLRDADIYQLPVMVSLLKVLRLQPPDATAFTNSNIDFHVAGEHLYFDRIDFTGDAISLWGSGEMSLERQLALKLFVQVGRGDAPIPIVGDLVSRVFREAGRNLLLIHVTGPLESPDLRPETFPGLNEMFEQMFPEEARAGARGGAVARP
jgi:hypothetical protein